MGEAVVVYCELVAKHGLPAASGFCGLPTFLKGKKHGEKKRGP